MAHAEVVDARLVKDFNTTPVGVGSAPGEFRRIGDLVYFSATTPLLGRELYATDGVTAQPQLVANFAAGAASSFPRALGQAGGKLLVQADDGVQGNALYALDRGSGARTALLHFEGGSGLGAGAEPVAQLAGHLLFTTGGYLHSTDGTLSGTQRLVDISSNGTLGESLCALAGGALFVAPSADAYQALWHTGGTRASNRVVTGLAQDGRLVDVSGNGSHCDYLFVRGNGWTVWRSDGNSAQLIAQQNNGMPRGVAAADSFAYVVDGIAGAPFRLWRSDLAAPLASYAQQSWESLDLRAVGSRLLFNAPYQNGSAVSTAMFLSDGTAAGTRRIAPAAGLQVLSGTHFAGGEMVVLVNGGGIWKIDLASGSVLRTGDGLPVGGELNGVFIGSRTSETTGEEVYSSTVAQASPTLLHDLCQANADGLNFFGVPGVGIGSTLYFSHVIDGQYGPTPRLALWRSDGSEAGTQPMPREVYGEGSVTEIARFGERIVFGAWPPNALQGYFLTDATFSTSSLLVPESPRSGLQAIGPQGGSGVLMGCRVGSDAGVNLCAVRSGESQSTLIAPGVFNSFPVGSTATAALFFRDYTIQRDGLWRSDGTAPGTFLIHPDLYEYGGRGVAITYQGRLLFPACRVSSGQCGIYISDGTQAGTLLVATLSGPLLQFVGIGERVAFVVGSTDANKQLWVTDGTPAGTAMLRSFEGYSLSPLASFGDRLHFVVGTPTSSGNGVTSYYISDGSPQGTTALALPPSLRVGGGDIVVLAGDTALFSCTTLKAGQELCAMGKYGGPVSLIRDIRPGPDGSAAQFIGATADAVYYSANDGYRGRELWQIKTWPEEIFRDSFQ